MKKLIALLLFICTANILVAQPYYFRRYQVENGLSNNTVFCSVQDGNGFMWFGTKDGLNRFDGYSFKTYRHDPDDKGTLGNDLIYSLHIDQQKTLYIGTNDGIYKYNPVNEQFIFLKGTKGMRISDMETDGENNLWIISRYKIFKYNKTTGRIYSFKENAPFNASSIDILSDGSIWISTGQGTLERYNSPKNVFDRFRVNNKKSSGWVSTIAETSKGNILIGTQDQGIKLMNLANREVKSIITFNADKTPIFVRDIKKVKEHEFWIGTESGIFIYNDINGKIIDIKKQFNNHYSISDNAIYTICTDNEGGVWAGSYFGGINYYSDKISFYTKYFQQAGENSINGSVVREIVKDNAENLWIGTEDAGLNKLNLKTGLFKHFMPDGKNGSISYSNIHGLLVDGNKLWIGTFEHGIDILDLRTEKVIKHYKAGVGNALLTNFAVTFLKTKSGTILVATVMGLYRYIPEKDDFELIPELPIIFYDSIVEDSDGNIWAGSFMEGLFKFNLQHSGYQNFKNSKKNPLSLSHNTINSIFIDSGKNIWITTDGGGLNKFDKTRKAFERFDLNNGFPSNYLFRIEEDKLGKFWISSTRGLIQFDPKIGLAKTYTQANGLLTDQFNYNSSFNDQNGKLYFGSVKGMISFRPQAYKTNHNKTPVYLTGFQINGAEIGPETADKVLNKSIVYSDTIILNHNQSSFSIDFAALSYQSPEMTEYAYKMTGLYNEWEYLKTNRKVYFTKLSAGTYVFEVKALIEGNKSWTTGNAKIIIKILPPFYFSLLAYFIYFIIGAAIICALIWRYHKRIEFKNLRRMEAFKQEKQKEVYQAKIEFFTNVAHEIRTPLTLIIGPMEKLIKQAHQIPSIEKNLKIMDRNTDRLLKLTNQLLDFRRTETSEFSLNFVQVDIGEILKDIVLQFQPAAELKNIVCHLKTPKHGVLAYVDVEAFYKIMSNLVDNAIKYGVNTVYLTLNESIKNDNFSITVQNDGLEISPDLADKIFEPFFRAKETALKTGTGIGLSISKSLTQLHNGKLFLDFEQKGLTTFVLVLPIRQLIEFNLNGKWSKS